MQDLLSAGFIPQTHQRLGGAPSWLDEGHRAYVCVPRSAFPAHQVRAAIGAAWEVRLGKEKPDFNQFDQ